MPVAGGKRRQEEAEAEAETGAQGCEVCGGGVAGVGDKERGTGGHERLPAPTSPQGSARATATGNYLGLASRAHAPTSTSLQPSAGRRVHDSPSPDRRVSS